MTEYKAPKSITGHPGVASCESGEANGSDYKHDVWLKDGWVFSYGRMTGCQGGLFHTFNDFRLAQPRRI